MTTPRRLEGGMEGGEERTNGSRSAAFGRRSRTKAQA